MTRHKGGSAVLDMEALAEWMPPPQSIAICAVSGGLDSMCLLHLLDNWCRMYGGTLTAAHFNHALRPNAARDEAFVRDWCADHGIACVTGRGDVRACAKEEGLSMEEAARKLRYAFLREEAEKAETRHASADTAGVSIYTAHHLNDSAETVLFNLIRGTGIRGLAGMSHRRDGIVRPLLDVTRAELEAYAAAHGIAHVEDESNADSGAAARNLIRLKVLPLLREINPQAERHIHAAAAQLRIMDQALEAQAREKISDLDFRDGYAALPLSILREAGEALWPRIVLYALDRLGVGRKDYGTAHLDAIRNLWMAPGRGRRVDLPHGVTARREGERLILERRPAPFKTVALEPGKSIQWGAYRMMLTSPAGGMPTEGSGGGVLLLAKKGVIRVGPCPPGARLALPGAKGSRTVKRLCLDRRISLTERDALPAFYINGELAAVWRLGVDAAFVPNGTAVHTIQIFPEKQDVSGK